MLLSTQFVNHFADCITFQFHFQSRSIRAVGAAGQSFDGNFKSWLVWKRRLNRIASKQQAQQQQLVQVQISELTFGVGN